MLEQLGSHRHRDHYIGSELIVLRNVFGFVGVFVNASASDMVARKHIVEIEFLMQRDIVVTVEVMFYIVGPLAVI